MSHTLKTDELPHEMTAYEFHSKKIGGANSPGAKGGIYTYSYQTEDHNNKRQHILFKQEVKDSKINHAANIREFVGGAIMNALIGDSAAKIILATSLPENKLPDTTGENVYIGSLFFEGYRDLYKEVFHGETLAEKLIQKDGRPLMVGTVNKKEFRKGFLDDKGEKCRFKDFEKVTVASLLVGDFDVHSGNYGVVTDEKGEKRLVKIDHGWALSHLTENVHMNSKLRHLPGMGPTNHFGEFPRKLRISKEFAEELEKQANNTEVKDTINKSLDEVASFYGALPVFEFIKSSGISQTQINSILRSVNIRDEEELRTKCSDPSFNDEKVKQALIHGSKKFLQNIMEKRQTSLHRLALEIKLSLCIKQNKKNGIFYFDNSIYDLDQLIKENPAYFKAGKFHFRDKDQRTLLGKLGDFGRENDPVQQHLTEMVNQRVKEVEMAVSQEVSMSATKNVPPKIEVTPLISKKENPDKDEELFLQAKEKLKISDELKPYMQLSKSGENNINIQFSTAAFLDLQASMRKDIAEQEIELQKNSFSTIPNISRLYSLTNQLTQLANEVATIDLSQGVEKNVSSLSDMLKKHEDLKQNIESFREKKWQAVDELRACYHADKVNYRKYGNREVVDSRMEDFYEKSYPKLSQEDKKQCNAFVDKIFGKNEYYKENLYAIARKQNPNPPAKPKEMSRWGYFKEKIKTAWNQSSFAGKFMLGVTTFIGAAFVAAGAMILSAATFGAFPAALAAVGGATLVGAGAIAVKKTYDASRELVYPSIDEKNKLSSAKIMGDLQIPKESIKELKQHEPSFTPSLKREVSAFHDLEKKYQAVKNDKKAIEERVMYAGMMYELSAKIYTYNEVENQHWKDQKHSAKDILINELASFINIKSDQVDNEFTDIKNTYKTLKILVRDAVNAGKNYSDILNVMKIMDRVTEKVVKGEDPKSSKAIKKDLAEVYFSLGVREIPPKKNDSVHLSHFCNLQIDYSKDMARDLYERARELFLQVTLKDVSPLGEHFDGIVLHVQNDILKRSNQDEMTTIMERWIKVMEESYRLGDFHTLMAINTALNSTPIARLSNDLNGRVEKLEGLKGGLSQEALEKFIELRERCRGDNLAYVRNRMNLENGHVRLGHSSSTLSIPYVGDYIRLIDNKQTNSETDKSSIRMRNENSIDILQNKLKGIQDNLTKQKPYIMKHDIEVLIKPVDKKHYDQEKKAIDELSQKAHKRSDPFKTSQVGKRLSGMWPKEPEVSSQLRKGI